MKERIRAMSAFTRCAAFALIALAGCTTRSSYLASVGVDRTASTERRLALRPHDVKSGMILSNGLGIAQAVAIGLRNNKTLQTAMLERDNARGAILQSYATALPRVSAAASYTRMGELMSFELGGQRLTAGMPDNYAAGISVYQPLFHGGAAISALNSATLGAVIADEQIRGASQGTVFAVSKAYYDVVLARQLLRVSEDEFKSASGHLEDVRRKKQQGMASEFDILRAQVAAANASAELVRKRNALHIADTTLMNVMGVSQDSSVTLTDEPRYKEVRPDFRETVGSTFSNRPDLVVAELTLRARREELKAEQGSLWPQFDLFFKYDWSKPDTQTFGSTDWGDIWTAGASMTFPLFDGFNRRGRIVRAETAVKQAAIRLEQAEEQALLEIKQSLINLDDAAEMVKTQSVTLDQAKEGLRLAEAGYNAGVSTDLQVIDARASLSLASSFYYHAVYAHALALLSLELTMGTLEPGNNPPPGSTVE